ncbi:MAG: hypothetical protein AAF915_05780 [Cyanobacteria bacterium P01_D01_bin.50]
MLQEEDGARSNLIECTSNGNKVGRKSTPLFASPTRKMCQLRLFLLLIATIEIRFDYCSAIAIIINRRR